MVQQSILWCENSFFCLKSVTSSKLQEQLLRTSTGDAVTKTVPRAYHTEHSDSLVSLKIIHMTATCGYAVVIMKNVFIIYPAWGKNVTKSSWLSYPQKGLLSFQHKNSTAWLPRLYDTVAHSTSPEYQKVRKKKKNAFSPRLSTPTTSNPWKFSAKFPYNW